MKRITPLLILATLVLAARPFLGRYKVVMDAHNEAVAPFTHAYWPITSLTRHVLRAADVTIVTNAALAEQVRQIGGNPHVLPDRLQKLSHFWICFHEGSVAGTPRGARRQRTIFQAGAVFTPCSDARRRPGAPCAC